MIIPRLDGDDFERGVRLYNQGHYWHAHEAWEQPWLAAESGSVERAFLQGLIQCAAAALKASIGNTKGTGTLCDRATVHLERVAETMTGAHYRGIAVHALIGELRAHRPPLRLTDSEL